MKTIGIICEYNPFHKGHAYQIEAVRQQHRASTIIAIMSGSFVQRGEPAYFSKFDRARWAILGGADVVIELPTIYSLGSAEIFSTGAIRMMKALNIDAISFGTELENMSVLKHAAQFLTTEHAQALIKETMQQGSSYGTSLRHVLSEHIDGGDALMSSPNAILGLEYIRSALTYHHDLEIIPIHRTSDHHKQELPLDIRSSVTCHHDTCASDTLPSNRPLDTTSLSTQSLDSFPSGTALRQALTEHQDIRAYVPASIAEDMNHIINVGRYIDYKRYKDALLATNRMLSVDTLKTLADFTEGIENRWRDATAATNWSDCIDSIKTKRYTYARLQRMAAYTVLSITKELMSRAHQEGPQYAHLLSFNTQGRQWLKTANTTIPIIAKWAQASKQLTELGNTLWQLDTKATDLQTFAFVNESQRVGRQDFTYSPQYIDI